MGTCYSVACLDCEVVRDLDKFYFAALNSHVDTREAMLELHEEMIADSGATWRALLLTQFAGKHKGHRLVFFSEHDESCNDYDAVNVGGRFKEDTDFWVEPTTGEGKDNE